MRCVGGDVCGTFVNVDGKIEIDEGDEKRVCENVGRLVTRPRGC